MGAKPISSVKLKYGLFKKNEKEFPQNSDRHDIRRRLLRACLNPGEMVRVEAYVMSKILTGFFNMT